MRDLIRLLAAGMLLFHPGKALSDTITVPAAELRPWAMNTSPPSGPIIGWATAITDRMSATPEFLVMPYKRVQAMLQDCFEGFVLLPEHPVISAVADKAAPLWDMEVRIHSRRETPIDSVAAMHGRAVGIILGSELLPEVNADRQIEKVAVENPKQLERMLRSGSVDAIVTIGPDCVLRLPEDAVGCVELTEVFHTVRVKTLAMAAWTPRCEAGRRVRDRVRAAVASLKEDGFFEEVVPERPEQEGLLDQDLNLRAGL